MSDRPMLRVLVCGGRSYANRTRVFAVLAAVHVHRGIGLVISGHAPGADALGELWAKIAGIPLVVEPADWATHGKAAGPIRNQKMLTEHKPELVVAFAGLRGTEDMKTRARKAGLEIIEGDQPHLNIGHTRFL